MARFRNPKDQARHALLSHIAHGVAKHNSTDGKIHSLGTERAYRQALTGFARFLLKHKLGNLQHFTHEDAVAYLVFRCESVGQKTVDLDRQAMQLLFRKALPTIKSERPQKLVSRAYTTVQAELIAQSQTQKYALSTRLALDAGLRAREILTLAPVEERKAATHRIFREDLFSGRQDVRLYTVIGKGGLVRVVAVGEALARELETRRLAVSRRVFDREIKYEQYYDLGGGKAWSDSFSRAAVRALGWSEGGHGLRHTFAQNRMDALLRFGYCYADALEVVSQELGHFRPDITEIYLR